MKYTSTAEQLFNDIVENKLSDLRDISTSINLDEQNRFNVIVTTPKLYLKNSGLHDEAEYQKLMQDPNNMLTFYRGTPYPQEEIHERVERNQQRSENKNPYTNYGIYNKDKTFIGFIAFVKTTSEEREEREEREVRVVRAVLVYIIDTNHWNQGYGKEAAYAILYNLLPTLLEASEHDPAVETVEATARQDNKASRKILKKIGLVSEGKTFYEKYDLKNLRKLYKIHTSEILEIRDTVMDRLNLERPRNSIINKPLVEECSAIPVSPTAISSIPNQTSSMQR